LLGNDVVLIAEVTFSSEQSASLDRAIGHSVDLLTYLKKTRQFPVEDWLTGVARVRDKMFAFEQMGLYAQALSGSDVALTPLQLPFVPGESWLALEFDPSSPASGERLLYTAHFPGQPSSSSACGLLVDEWTEVIPATQETVGLTFNYDRPASEPPQAWLLVTAPRIKGSWSWTDVLGALDETFELMRIRATQPTDFEDLPYARFLPATTSAAALNDISITLNLARVNDFASHLKDKVNG
jgi:hypothetical protein